jgi:hypothetical protein
MSHELSIRFRFPGPNAASVEAHLRKLQPFLKSLEVYDPSLKDTEWLISTGERESSLLYEVFDAAGPTTKALAVFREDLKKNDAVKSLSMWNGQQDRSKAASIAYFFDRQDGASDWLRLSVRSAPDVSRLGPWEPTVAAIRAACLIYNPLCVTLTTPNYDPVFKDRLGVGWMLYLPQVITQSQVPEAAAVVPTMGEGAKQAGTIIVSVTGEPFSDQNPEHVKSAHAIEIRLVDQDLLPRHVNL